MPQLLFCWDTAFTKWARAHGRQSEASVLNKYSQSHDIKNLFVVDGSSFVTCGWQNPTMTILASEHLADE